MKIKNLDKQEIILESLGEVKLAPRLTWFEHAAVVGDRLIVLENYYQAKGSNLYALDSKGDMLWSAELPSEADAFVDDFSIADKGILSFSWHGLRCLLDMNTGKILQKEFVK